VPARRSVWNQVDIAPNTAILVERATNFGMRIPPFLIIKIKIKERTLGSFYFSEAMLL
jgi:hypothetical protein